MRVNSAWTHISSTQTCYDHKPKTELILIGIYTVTLDFGSNACQMIVGIVQVNIKSAWNMSDLRLLFHALLAYINPSLSLLVHNNLQLTWINH